MVLSYEQIEDITNYNSKMNNHFMPNEIFEDLQANLSKSPHITFAYSYYYLISWLFRNTTYGFRNITPPIIKQLLGYSKTTKTINFLIKEGGVLDRMGYTQTTKNYPYLWEFDDGELEFFFIEEADESEKKYHHEGKANNFKIKYPVKHFYRSKESLEDDHMDGIFYDISNTHEVPFEVFIHCMSIKGLGTNAFYLYSYLKMMNQIHGGGYDIALRYNEELKKDGLEQESGLSYMTLNRTLDALRKYRLVDVIHNQEYFSRALDQRKANTYITNDADDFLLKPQPYKKMEVKTVEEHKEIIRKKLREENKFKGDSEKVEISLEELPY